MDYRAQYRQLVRELERLGGDLRGVPRYYSLEAEAKVRRLIKERQGGGGEPPRANGGGEQTDKGGGESLRTKDKGELPFAPTTGEGELPRTSGEQAKREDLIADYPVALHGVYRAKREAWLRACSLKLTLNAVPMEEEDKAREIQRQLWQLFSAMDNYDVVLQYWRLWVLNEKIARKREEVEQMKLQVKEVEKLLVVSN